MKTREIAAEYRMAHWTQIMRERAQSGLNTKEYCKSIGLRENVYYYWQRKLREVACEQMSVQGFTEVKLGLPATQSALSEVNLSGQLQMEIRGVRITADSAYPTEKLVALLRALS